MNVETGEIVELKTGKEWLPGRMVPVKDGDMTEKQKRTKQVSRHDTRSKLGMIFTGNRKERRKALALARQKRR